MLQIINRTNIRKSIFYIRNYGLKTFIIKLRNKIVSVFSEDRKYRLWIKKNEPNEKNLEEQRHARFDYEPKISIITPVFNAPKKILIEMIESVINQTYAKWELCIADGSSKEHDARDALQKYAEKDNRLKIKFLQKNKGIAGNSNEALSDATGDFVTFLDHDDKLAPFALYEIVKAINENINCDFIYSDEDKITEDGKKRFTPHFKPDWSPDALRSYNYITHLTVIRRKLLDKIGWFRVGFDGSQDYDLILRATEQAERIVHIPKILYHWRASEDSTAANPFSKLYAYEAAKKALKEHLLRIGLKGEVHDGPLWGTYTINYMIEGNPTISIIIPNWNGKQFLKGCLDSLRGQTFKDFEIIVVDNNSDDDSVSFVKENYPEVRIIELDTNKGFAGGVNEGIKASKGDLIFLLNNDTVVDLNCLQVLHEAAVKNPNVGFFATKMIFHGINPPVINAAGDAFGIDGAARNIGYKEIDVRQYDKEREVFGACAGAALYKRKMFDEIGLFDEDFYIILEDVDLDFRAQLAGYRCLYVPSAVVYHIHAGSMGKTSDFTFYWITRNDFNVLIKNMPLFLLFKHFHRIFFRQIIYTYARLLGNKIRPLISGEFSAFLLLPVMLSKRYQILKGRKVSVSYIDKILFKDEAVSVDKLKRFTKEQEKASALNYLLSIGLFIFTELVNLPIFILSIMGCALIDAAYFFRRRIFHR